MKVWFHDEKGQSFSDAEDADKVETFSAAFASLFTIRSQNFCA